MIDIVKGTFLFFVTLFGVYFLILVVKALLNKNLNTDIKSQSSKILKGKPQIKTESKKASKAESKTSSITEVHEEHLGPNGSKHKLLLLAGVISCLIFFLGNQGDFQFFYHEENTEKLEKPEIVAVEPDNSSIKEEQLLSKSNNIQDKLNATKQPEVLSIPLSNPNFPDEKYMFEELEWEGKFYMNFDYRNVDDADFLLSDKVSFLSGIGKRVAVEDSDEILYIIESTPLSDKEFLCKTNSGLLIILTQQESRSEITRGFNYKLNILVERPVKKYALCTDGIAFTYEEKLLGLYWYSFKQKHVIDTKNLIKIDAIIAQGNRVIYSFNNRYVDIATIVEDSKDALKVTLEVKKNIDSMRNFDGYEQTYLYGNESSFLICFNNTMLIYDIRDASLIASLDGRSPKFMTEDTIAYLNGSFVETYSIIDKKTRIITEIFQPYRLTIIGDLVIALSVEADKPHLDIVDMNKDIALFETKADYTVILNDIGGYNLLQLYNHLTKALQTIASGGIIEYKINEESFDYKVHIGDENSMVRENGSIVFEKDAKIDFYYPLKNYEKKAILEGQDTGRIEDFNIYWNEDQTRCVFHERNDLKFYDYNKKGGSAISYITSYLDPLTPFVPSPDGRYIATTSGTFVLRTLLIIDSWDGSVVVGLPSYSIGGKEVCWSPDSKSLAYTQPNEQRIGRDMDPDVTNDVMIFSLETNEITLYKAGTATEYTSLVDWTKKGLEVATIPVN